jgi:hypothetical protein
MGLWKILRGAGIVLVETFGWDDNPPEATRSYGSRDCARCGLHISHIYWVGGQPYGSKCYQVVLQHLQSEYKKELEASETALGGVSSELMS